MTTRNSSTHKLYVARSGRVARHKTVQRLCVGAASRKGEGQWMRRGGGGGGLLCVCEQLCRGGLRQSAVGSGA